MHHERGENEKEPLEKRQKSDLSNKKVVYKYSVTITRVLNYHQQGATCSLRSTGIQRELYGGSSRRLRMDSLYEYR